MTLKKSATTTVQHSGVLQCPYGHPQCQNLLSCGHQWSTPLRCPAGRSPSYPLCSWLGSVLWPFAAHYLISLVFHFLGTSQRLCLEPRGVLGHWTPSANTGQPQASQASRSPCMYHSPSHWYMSQIDHRQAACLERGCSSLVDRGRPAEKCP